MTGCATIGATWLSSLQPGALLLGVVIGLLTGLFGVGGGFLLTPCLKVFFGLSYPVAVGTSLASIFCTGMISAWRHGRRGNVAWRLGALMAFGALFGTRLGKGMMARLQAETATLMLFGRAFPLLDTAMNGLFLLLLCGVLAVVLFEQRQSGGARSCKDDDPLNLLACRLHGLRLPPHIRLPREGVSISVWIPLAVSVGVGCLTGLLGVGGGFVLFPILVYVLGVPTLAAVGTSAFQLVFAGGFGTWLYAVQRQIDVAVLALLVLGALFGTECGVRLAQAVNVKRLRGHFGYVVAAGIGVVLYDLVWN